MTILSEKKGGRQAMETAALQEEAKAWNQQAIREADFTHSLYAILSYDPSTQFIRIRRCEKVAQEPHTLCYTTGECTCTHYQERLKPLNAKLGGIEALCKHSYIVNAKEVAGFDIHSLPHIWRMVKATAGYSSLAEQISQMKPRGFESKEAFEAARKADFGD